MGSEFAQLCRRIDAENQAGRDALEAPAVVAPHQFIIARLQRETEQLIAECGFDQAMQIMMHRLEEEI